VLRSRSLDFLGEAEPDGAPERGSTRCAATAGSAAGFWQRRRLSAACRQDREDFMREDKRTRLGATNAWAPATRLAVGLTERSHRRSAYDEPIDRILGRGHNLDDQ
jgi:hypothetical protein